MLECLTNENFILDLLNLKSAPERFYLTGSHFFSEGKGGSSDVDFFAQDSESMRAFLGFLGFRKLAGHQYLDNNTAVVYKKGVIDIQLVNNAEVKLVAQTRIKRIYPNFSSLSKSKQQEVWEIAFAFCEA